MEGARNTNTASTAQTERLPRARLGSARLLRCGAGHCRLSRSRHLAAAGTAHGTARQSRQSRPEGSARSQRHFTHRVQHPQPCSDKVRLRK